jgi:hypothetical protein
MEDVQPIPHRIEMRVRRYAGPVRLDLCCKPIFYQGPTGFRSHKPGGFKVNAWTY